MYCCVTRWVRLPYLYDLRCRRGFYKRLLLGVWSTLWHLPGCLYALTFRWSGEKDGGILPWSYSRVFIGLRCYKGFYSAFVSETLDTFFSTALGTSLGFADCYKCAYRLFFLFAAPFHPLQWTGWAGGCLFIVYLLWGLG